MLKKYQATPKTRGGKVLYAILCAATLVILIGMAVAPVVLVWIGWGDPWWELSLLLLPVALVPLYTELLALLAALHYLARRRSGNLIPTKRSDVSHVIYGVCGIQCLWVLPSWMGIVDSHWPQNLFMYAIMPIVLVGLSDLVRTMVRKARAERQARQAEAEADRAEWEQKLP